MAAFLSEAATAAAAAVLAARKTPSKVLKADDDRELQYLAAAYQAIEWESVVHDVEDDLEDAAEESGLEALLAIKMSNADMISVVNEIAADFASRRAAEMVGMKYDEDGALVENPDAKWAISDTTRDDLRDLIEQAFKQEAPIADLAQSIMEAGTFSAARAKMIADTEVQWAQARSSVETWQHSGLVIKTDWQVSNLDPCVVCLAFSEGGPYPLKTTPIPVEDSHPHCHCVLRVASVSQKAA